ncbi:hypothetical protein WH87_04610 [Devosia epidermidihirudinis]|uniref:Uncharacterized protein n=1 Tax=Devosia epidermidihirudinis TaxID=1293439 RepID=A0A0F5QFG4_9HYPH|nr:hypothetical protein WH87_04610 [Devosia epidermidihirudinis]
MMFIIRPAAYSAEQNFGELLSEPKHESGVSPNGDDRHQQEVCLMFRRLVVALNCPASAGPSFLLPAQFHHPIAIFTTGRHGHYLSQLSAV